MIVDLHLHTTCSDGIFSPERLFEEVRSRRLEAFCVSDHDGVDAYPVPDDLQDRVIPGLEVDSHHGGHTVHILAYGIDDPRSPLLLTLSEQRVRRVARMEQMLARMGSLGLEVTIDDVRAVAQGSRSLGRPHLARALVEKGYVASVQEAFDRYLADDGDGYVALERQTADRTIAAIHDSGGVAIIAHPVRLRAPEHLIELCDIGADGIEVVHPTADHAARTHFESIARERGLLITGGTDFHAPGAREIGIEFRESDIAALRSAIQTFT